MTHDEIIKECRKAAQEKRQGFGMAWPTEITRAAICKRAYEDKYKELKESYGN